MSVMAIYRQLRRLPSNWPLGSLPVCRQSGSFRVQASGLERTRPQGPLDVGLARQDWCDRSADFSSLVIKSPKREGRIRSAERTEVHLIATIRFHELTFCP